MRHSENSEELKLLLHAGGAEFLPHITLSFLVLIFYYGKSQTFTRVDSTA